MNNFTIGPPYSSPLPSRPHGSRFCTLLEMSPSMLTLVACVVAIVAALIWRSYWLCIPFGIGAVASCHNIYLSYYAHATRSIHESSDFLRQEVIDLKTEVSNLKDVRFRLTDAISSFETILKVDCATSTTLTDRVDALGNRCTALMALTNEFSNKLGQMDETIQTISNLKDALKRQTEEQGSVNESINNHLTLLSQNTPVMTQLVGAIKELSLGQKIKELTQIHGEIVASRVQLEKVKAQTEHSSQELDTKIKELGNMTNALDGVKCKLEQAQTRYCKTAESVLELIEKHFNRNIPTELKESIFASFKEQLGQ